MQWKVTLWCPGVVPCACTLSSLIQIFLLLLNRTCISKCTWLWLQFRIDLRFEGSWKLDQVQGHPWQNPSVYCGGSQVQEKTGWHHRWVDGSLSLMKRSSLSVLNWIDASGVTNTPNNLGLQRKWQHWQRKLLDHCTVEDCKGQKGVGRMRALEDSINSWSSGTELPSQCRSEIPSWTKTASSCRRRWCTATTTAKANCVLQLWSAAAYGACCCQQQCQR